MKYLFLLFMLSSTVGTAQSFTGYYTAANWQKSGTGDINYAYAPEAIGINGIDNVNTDFTIKVDRPGAFSFTWEYAGDNITAGVLINSVFYPLSSKGEYTSTVLAKGDILGFRVKGAGTMIISNFKPPAEVPNCNIKIYPNPAVNNVRLQLGCFDDGKEVILYNAIGQLLDRIITTGGIIDYNTSRLPMGAYFFLSDGKTYRFVK